MPLPPMPTQFSVYYPYSSPEPYLANQMGRFVPVQTLFGAKVSFVSFDDWTHWLDTGPGIIIPWGLRQTPSAPFNSYTLDPDLAAVVAFCDDIEAHYFIVLFGEIRYLSTPDQYRRYYLRWVPGADVGFPHECG